MHSIPKEPLPENTSSILLFLNSKLRIFECVNKLNILSFI